MSTVAVSDDMQKAMSEEMRTWDSLSRQQQKRALDRRKENPKYPQDYKPALMDDIAPTEVPVTAQGKVLRALGWKGATKVEQRRYKAKTGKVKED